MSRIAGRNGFPPIIAPAAPTGGIRRAVWAPAAAALLLGASGLLSAADTAAPRDPIRAFCIDFNWGPGGPNGFAPPGMWADADPAAHVAWYAALGANVIQTFAVSCNGYAWYKDGKIPAQPGLKHDFLPEVVRLGHAKGLKVMGYFCAGANSRWGAEHPDLSYGAPGACHIPFTDAYLDHLAASIDEALGRSGMDGFMVDWLWNPSDKVRNGKWLAAEKQLFEQLTGRPFPGESALTPEAKLDYERKAIDRCWARIRSVAKKAKPDCVIWLSCNKVADPAIAGSSLLREVDWMMDESGTPAAMRSLAPMLGPHTRPVLCVVGWGDRHDARKVCADAANAEFGIYGFARPNPDSLPLPVARCLAEPPESFTGNDRNIAMLARYFNGRPLPPPAAAPARSDGVSPAEERSSMVDDRVDWPAFLGRLDPVWESLPAQFDCGAFLGNGLLGATIYQDGERGLRWEMGRTDVTEHRRDNNRLPIGGLVLETVGRIRGGKMRLDLCHAEVRGEVTTERGALRFRSLVHAQDPVLLIECEFDGDEKEARFAWKPGHGQDRRNLDRFHDPPNPPAVTETNGGMPVCVQPRQAGGEFATAWMEAPAPSGRRMVVSVADSFPLNTARREAAAAVRAFAAVDSEQRIAAHRAWWRAVYPRSFVSVPDAKLESFYWIQIYKLASASRPDKGPVDLLGPWFRDTSWPRIWWNLNIQTLYLPVYTANQLELGESLVRFLDAKRGNFARNAKEIWNVEDGATVPHTTDREGLRGDGSCAPDHYINPGDFTWALHNYWLHYRYSMDHALVTNQTEHAFYPLLKGSVNVYLSLLKKSDDGRLHLPVLHSPEYGNAADNNYNLALLRWGCRTLLELDRRYALNDPLASRWREVLDTLADPPVDETGLRIGSDLAVSKSHRHWSHMLMAHPLHIVDLDEPAQRELLQRSIRHWLTVDGGRGIYGWSMAAAASLHAALGDGDRAIESIHRHLDDARFVRPNTMYIEGSPVIECSIVLARSLQDMLLQSHGGVIRVFPAVPGAWKDAVFHNLRAEGAFLVSAERKDGAVRWVRVRSLAGEPCRIRPGFAGEARIRAAPEGARLTPLGGGAYELNLARGAEALLFVGEDPGVPVVRPLAIAAADANPHGVKAAARGPAQQGTFRASSEWGKGFEAGKAFDGDEATRWGAAPGSRSGWIEVDLGGEAVIGRAVVKEIGFPRTEKFAVEFKDGEIWKPLVTGAGIRGRRTYDFAPVRARVFRLNILEASEVPTIEEFHLFEK